MATYLIPTQSQVTSWFNRIDYMLVNAIVQNSDGSYGGGYVDMDPPSVCKGTHPVVRETAHAVMGYSQAYISTQNEDYKTKAINGLSWLLNEQDTSGGFNWWCTNSGGLHPYETGLGGRALIEGYLAFGDQQYLTASQRAYNWEANYGVYTGNANYNAFPITHMVRLYEATGDSNVLDTAIEFSKYMVSGDPSSHQTSNGYWNDYHNQIYYYHMMITRALIMVVANMPTSHPDYTMLHNAASLAFNYVKNHQNNDGSMWFDPSTALNTNPDEAEDYLSDGLMIANGRIDIDVSDVLYGLLQFQFSRNYTGINATGVPPTSTRQYWRESFENKPACAGTALRYFSGCVPPNCNIIISS